MNWLVALLLLGLAVALAGGARADDGRSRSPAGVTDGTWEGLRLVRSVDRSRTRADAPGPLGRSLLAAAADEAGDACAAQYTTLDVLRRLAGTVSGIARRLMTIEPAALPGRLALRILSPRVASLPVPLRLPLAGALRGFLEPALDLGWTTSRLTLAQVGSTSGDDASGPGFGFQLAVGLQMSVGDVLALSVKAGWRVLRAPAPDPDAFAGAALTRLATAAGDANLGGAYGGFGAVLRI